MWLYGAMDAPVSITRYGAGHKSWVTSCQRARRRRQGIAVAAQRRRGALLHDRVLAEGAEEHAAVVVEERGRRDQVGGAANQVWPATFEAVGGVVGEADSGHQRLVDVGAVVVEGLRRDHRIVEAGPQVR